MGGTTGDFFWGLADAVGTGLEVTDFGESLTELIQATPSFAKVANAAVQGAALVFDAISVPAQNVYPSAVFFNIIGFGTGYAVLLEDAEQYGADKNPVIPLPDQAAKVQADVLTLQADGLSLLSNILGCVGGILQADKNTKIYGKLLSVGATVATGYALLLKEKASSGETPSMMTQIVATVTKLIAAVNADIPKIQSNGTAQSLLGPSYASVLSTVSSTMSAVSSLISSNASDPQFSSYVTTLQNIGSAAQSLIVNLGTSSGAAAETLNESDAGGDISVANTLSSGGAGTFSLVGGDAVNAQTGSVEVSSFLTSTNADFTSNSLLSPNAGLETTIALTGTGGDANEFDDLNANATLGESFVFEGLTIQAPDSASFEYDTAASDALMLVVAAPGDANSVTIDHYGGYDQVLLNGQQLFNYQPEFDDLGNPQLDISLSQSGSFDITAALGSDDSGTVNDDANIAGVVQNFQFGKPNDILAIYNPASFFGTISNFQAGDILYLVGATTNDGVTNLSATSGGQLLVPESAGGYLYLQLDPAQNYSNLNFMDENDGDGIELIAGDSIATSGPLTAMAYDTLNTYTAVFTTITTKYGYYVQLDSFNTYSTVYSAGAAFSVTNVDFGAERAGDGSRQFTIGVSFVPGNLEPGTADDVFIYNGESEDGVFSTSELFSLGNIGSIVVSEDAFLYEGQGGSLIDDPIPVLVEYNDAGTTITILASGEIYVPAFADASVPGPEPAYYDFGIIHVGQTESVDVTVSNGAAGVLTDVLSSTAGTDGIFTAGNAVNDLAAGQSGVISVSVESDLPGEYVADDASVFGFVSQDPALPDEALNPGIVLAAEVYDYAQPVISDFSQQYGLGGGATLTQYGYGVSLNFGTIVQNSSQFYGTVLEIQDAVEDEYFRDNLAGVILSSGSGFTTELPASFNYSAFLSIDPVVGTVGANTMVVVIEPLSVDAASTTALPDITITVTDDLVAAATCFAAGTRIATPGGEVPVEALQVGDWVRTLHAGAQRVRWIGRRDYDGRFIRGNHMALPIRIRAGALGTGVPQRDLVVSPGHGMFVGGVLVPAWRLVDGVRITQAEAVDAVTYFHVELQRHEVLLAENCPAESFLDGECLGQFQNAATHGERLYMAGLARVEAGPVLEAMRKRLGAGGGGALRGFVDMAGPERVSGWAQDIRAPEAPVWLDVLAQGRRVARLLANAYRADLRAAGLGSGCHGFEVAIPAYVRGAVEVRRAGDGARLVEAFAEVA